MTTTTSEEATSSTLRRRNRQRRPGASDVSSSSACSTSDTLNTDQANNDKDNTHDGDMERKGSSTSNDDGLYYDPPSGRKMTMAWMVWGFLHVLACAMYIYGMVLRQQVLHNSQECIMTYSQRQLIPIPIVPTTTPINNKFGLYKFVDQRDPRPHHRAMLHEWLQVVRQTQQQQQQTNSNHQEDYQEATRLYLQKIQSPQRQSSPSQKTVLKENHYCDPTAEVSSTTSENTTSDTVAVLYIPGHWGSYMQSRSIGAHGIQLTAAQDRVQTQTVVQALAQQSWKGRLAAASSNHHNSSSSSSSRSTLGLDHFVFDVYAVDFREQGGALHAHFLLSQTAFVARAIQHLTKTCQLSQIIVLGHSMGGYVARLVPMLYPETRPYLQTMITLGTPHAHAVFGWEASLYELHQRYLSSSSSSSSEGRMSNHAQGTTNNNGTTVEHNMALVAISGGLRDEMIPPLACNAVGALSHSISVLAPVIMDPGPMGANPHLGMDHRGIVWCHNLLSVVRRIIFSMVQHDNNNNSTGASSPTKRLEQVTDLLSLHDDDNGDHRTTDYHAALQEHQSKFMKLYGFLPSLAMECAMLYHLEVLVGLYVLLACCKWAGLGWIVADLVIKQSLAVTFVATAAAPWMMNAVPLTMAIGLATRTNYDIHVLSLAILALVAHAVQCLVQWVLVAAGWACIHSKQQNSSGNQDRPLLNVRLLSTGLCLLLLGVQCVGKFSHWRNRMYLSFIAAVYVCVLGTGIVIQGGMHHLSTAGSESQRTHVPSGNAHYFESSRWLGLSSLLFLMTPFLITGQVMALLSIWSLDGRDEAPSIVHGIADFLPSSGLQSLTVFAFLPIGIRTAWYHHNPSIRFASTNIDTARAAIMFVSILLAGPSLFQMGQGFRAGELLAVLGWVECFFLPFC